jgi:hypothetical protein
MIKKIKEDSVIILTVKQGEQINNLYKRYNDTIGLLKDSLGIKTYKYDSIFNKILVDKDSVFEWKWKYKANKEIYLERERDLAKDKRNNNLIKYTMLFIIYFQFTQLR